MSRKLRPLRERDMRQLEKGQIHEHIDCSTKPRFMLKRWFEKGFDKVNPKLPRDIVLDWRAAQELRDCRNSRNCAELIDYLETRAALRYQKWLARFASKSLANYVQCIRDHILPLMQTSLDLYEITRDRIADAVEDGHIFLELRFAPQLHTFEGLTLDQVMEAVTAAVKESPIPVKLIVCALRHEDDKKFVPHNPVNELADIAIKYPEVGVFDLAADEAAYSGVLDWYIGPAKRVQAAGKILDIHLGETNALTAAYTSGLKKLYPFLTTADRRRLASTMKQVVALAARLKNTADPDKRLKLFDQIASLLDSIEELIYKSGRIGHGIRGDHQGTYVLGCCPTSNVVTGQVPSIAKHPIGKFLREGKLVTINTDGTLFTLVDLTREYVKLQKAQDFTVIEFYICNRIALAASSFSTEVKAQLKAKLNLGYRRRIGSR